MRYRKADDVREKTLGEAFFVFTPRGGFYGFDGVGRHIWRLVVAGHSQEEIVETIAAEYDAAAAAVGRDVAEFVSDVLDQRLVVPLAAVPDGA
jgi:hypothetical protein